MKMKKDTLFDRTTSATQAATKCYPRSCRQTPYRLKGPLTLTLNRSWTHHKHLCVNTPDFRSGSRMNSSTWSPGNGQNGSEKNWLLAFTFLASTNIFLLRREHGNLWLQNLPISGVFTGETLQVFDMSMLEGLALQRLRSETLLENSVFILCQT